MLLVSRPVFFKTAFNAYCLQGIFNAEKHVFQLREMVCWSNIICQALDLLYLHTQIQQPIYAESTTLLRNQ